MARSSFRGFAGASCARRNPRGNGSARSSPGYGVNPPSAHSEPNFIVSQRSSSTTMFSARSSPATIRSITSTPRVEPMRQGVHLPQDSMAQNSMAKRACFAMSTVSSKTTMPPWPISPSRGGEGLVVERRVEQRAREIGAERPADLHGAHRAARARAAADVVDQLAERDAEGGLEQAAMLDVAGELDRHRAARPAHAEIAVIAPRRRSG